MHRPSHSGAGVFLLASLLCAQESRPDPAAELKQLQKDLQAAQKEFYRPYSEAKTDEERSKVKLDFSKRPETAFVPKFLDLAARAKGTDAAFDALLFVVSGGAADAKVVAETIGTLSADFASSPRLAELAETLARNGTPAAGKALDAMIESSPHKDVKAAALLARGSALCSKYIGKRDSEEGRQYLERVVKEHGDSKQAARAKAILFSLDNLQVGMVAPDFESVDLDGQKLKVSDYRGKVLVLDFWGDW
jgi:NADPH-dependent ferric siderophore reductase